MKSFTWIALACVLCFSVASARPPEKQHDANKTSPAFEALKSLAGTWLMQDNNNDGKPDGETNFRVIANGSVVVETMFPGSKQEMVNTYHMDGNAIMATHYCAQGVQPRMKLANADDAKSLKFDYLDCTNLTPGEGHMGALELKIDGDTLIENWGYVEDGKVTGTTSFALHRKG